MEYLKYLVMFSALGIPSLCFSADGLPHKPLPPSPLAPTSIYKEGTKEPDGVYFDGKKFPMQNLPAETDVTVMFVPQYKGDYPMSYIAYSLLAKECSTVSEGDRKQRLDGLNMTREEEKEFRLNEIMSLRESKDFYPFHTCVYFNAEESRFEWLLPENYGRYQYLAGQSLSGYYNKWGGKKATLYWDN